MESLVKLIRRSVHAKIGAGILRHDLEHSGWNENEIEYIINAILDRDA